MIYLVRHGESDANIQKRYCGITDAKLSQKGRDQAAAAGQNLRHETICRVYSSPLERAVDTAKIICSKNNICENKIIKENCLLEVNFGMFENMTWDEISSDYKEETEKWISEKNKYRFPKGESYDDIIERVAPFIDKVPDNSVVVTHFGVIQSVLLYLGVADSTNLWDFMISNCDIVVLNYKNYKNIKKFEKIIKCKE
jgi:alpha-ribazole phosphatase